MLHITHFYVWTLKQYSNSAITNCEVPWPIFGYQTNVDTAYRKKRKQIDLKVKDLYWIIGKKSPTFLLTSRPRGLTTEVVLT
jgi:hypothetical protein